MLTHPQNNQGHPILFTPLIQYPSKVVCDESNGRRVPFFVEWWRNCCIGSCR